VPGTVYDTAQLSASQPFRIDFLQGSARLSTNLHPKGTALADPWTASGALIGTREMDGVLPPRYRDAAFVTILARITFVTANS
jgi:hypothetical protein